ncbi:MAG: hypothetical protein IT242_11325 [Bacteroidia bacterium]|nr:hypothetical protein [Bacteroidia bacterium]
MSQADHIHSGRRFTLGNTACLLWSGDGFFTRLEEAIHQAVNEIHFQTYIFNSDDTGRKIANALMRASEERGVKVFLLADAYGSQQLSGSFLNELRKSGIQVRKYGRLYSRGKFHLGRRLHRKVTVIDGKIAFVGGMNISNNYNEVRGEKAWLDLAVELGGESVRELQEICRQRWLHFPFKTFSKKKNTGTSDPVSGLMLPVRISQNDYLHQKNEIANTYRKVFSNATSSVYIVGGYFLPGGRARRIIKKSIRRSVMITLIVSRKSDVWISILARKYLYNWMLRNNIRIFEYLPSNVHGKVLVADNHFTSIGSYDLNNLSTYSNIELNVDIDDEAIASSLVQRLEEIIRNDCRAVTAAEFGRTRTLDNRLKEWAAYRIVKTLFVLSLWLSQAEDRDL